MLAPTLIQWDTPEIPGTISHSDTHTEQEVQLKQEGANHAIALHSPSRQLAIEESFSRVRMKEIAAVLREITAEQKAVRAMLTDFVVAGAAKIGD